MMKKITDFLKTKRTEAELSTALEVIKDFKNCESLLEWNQVPFPAWAKLEQLEEFLNHLVNNKELDDDTISYMNLIIPDTVDSDILQGVDPEFVKSQRRHARFQ